MIDKKELTREVLNILKQATAMVIAKLDAAPEESEEIISTLMECLSTELGYVERVANVLGMNPDDVVALRERYLLIGMKAAAQEHSEQLAFEREETS